VERGWGPSGTQIAVQSGTVLVYQRRLAVNLSDRLVLSKDLEFPLGPAWRWWWGELKHRPTRIPITGVEVFTVSVVCHRTEQHFATCVGHAC
jgi:hypothetical protein